MRSARPTNPPEGEKSGAAPPKKAASQRQVSTAPLNRDGGGTATPTTTKLKEKGIDSHIVVPVVGGLPVAHPSEPTPEEAARSFRTRRRSLLWAGCALLSLILIVETVLLSPWTDPVAGVPPRPAATVPLSEVDHYGANVFLHKEVDLWKKQKTLDMAVDVGAGWIKQQFPWAEIEFGPDNYWDAKNNQSAWEKFDNIVALSEQRGLRIIARIDSTPEWARTDDTMPPSVQDALRGNPKVPPAQGHMKDFAEFIKTFVLRYQGRVQVIQIWNEPNLYSEWQTGVDARSYVNLLATAYMAAKEADPNMIILAAPLATTNDKQVLRGDPKGNLDEIDYLQAMYYAGAQPYFDAMSANAYGTNYPPEDPPSPDKLNFRRVELLRSVMVSSNDSNKAIWFNEYGWNASPPDLPSQPGQVTYPWGHVTPEQQADYTTRGIQYAEAHWPWAGVFTIWYLRQVGDIPQTSSEYYFSLVNPEFVPGLAYEGVQKAANAEDQRVAKPGEWGPLTSQVQAGAPWEVGLSPAVPGGMYLVPSAETGDGDALSVTFQGTDVTLGLVPLATSAAVTTTVPYRYYVSVDGSSHDVSSNLPRDGQGRAYINLPSTGQATEVQVVQGLGSEFSTGKHTLSILVGSVGAGQGAVGAGHVAAPVSQPQATGLPGIGTITVQANRAYWVFWIITLLLIAGIAIEAWGLWRSSSRAVKGAEAGGARGR